MISFVDVMAAFFTRLSSSSSLASNDSFSFGFVGGGGGGFCTDVTEGGAEAFSRLQPEMNPT